MPPVSSIASARTVLQSGSGPLPGRHYLPSRHDEDVSRSLRVDVVERDDVVVLVNDRRLDLAVHDAAEQTVGHGARHFRGNTHANAAVRPRCGRFPEDRA